MRATTTPRFNRRRWLVAGIVAVAAAVGAAPASAVEFDFAPGSPTVELLDGNGDPHHQAGSHPDLRVGFDLTTQEPDATGAIVPSESLRDVDVWLPPGILGNLNAVPICDSMPRGADQCPRNTAVGEVRLRIALQPSQPMWIPEFLVMVHRLPAPKGVAARFGFQFLGIAVAIDSRLTPDGGYRLASTVDGVSTASMVFTQELTLWGVPADRYGPGPKMTMQGQMYGGPGDGPRLPFIWAPTRCGVPLDASIAISSWQQPERTVTATPRISDGLTGCDQLPFAPTLSVQPDSPVAGQPSGYAIDLELPQQEGPDDLTTSQLRDATVILPEGVAISPGRARGLDVCTDEQLGEGSAAAESCPSASRIGELRIDSPLLPDPLTGTVYMGQQRSQDPASGEMYRMFMVAYDPATGVRIKLRGQVKADPRTGQLTTTFAENPELPFSRLSLRLDGGERAALVNPVTCGEKTASLAATAWSGSSTTDASTFAIDQGCSMRGFSPGLLAGTVDPLARQFSPFAMTVKRADGDQDLSRIGLELPSGLLGALGSVPLCAEAQAAAGTCDAVSRIGSMTVTAGTGPAPYALDGQVFLGGPYRGAPFSLAFVVPAQAGPYDLGVVVVRAALFIDPDDAHVRAVSDPLPQIVGGVPLRYRQISVAIDRPGFMHNPSDCSPKQVQATILSAEGTRADVANHFQAANCAALPFEPRIALRLKGRRQAKTGGHPAVQALVRQQGIGEAGIKRAVVRLPRSLALDPDNAQALCEFEDGTKPDLENHCPEGSIVGRARAVTPLLKEDLVGDVYFVKNVRIDPETGNEIRTLPMLVVALRGEIAINLVGESSTMKNGRLVNRFASVPDAPISRFNLNIKGGKNGILAVTRTRRSEIDLCSAGRQVAVAKVAGHNGKRADQRIRVGTPCPKGRPAPVKVCRKRTDNRRGLRRCVVKVKRNRAQIRRNIAKRKAAKRRDAQT